MIDMPSQAQAICGYGSTAIAVSGGLVAQVATDQSVANGGLYLGAGGLAAALALLVSSMGDKMGPHVVAIAKLWVENRAINIKLKAENLTLAQRVLEMETRLTTAEAAAATARDKANAAEDLAIELKTRAEMRFQAVEGRVNSASRKADDANRTSVSNASRLDAVESANGSGSGDDTPAAPPPEPK